MKIKISEEQNLEIQEAIKEALNPNGGKLSLKYNAPNGQSLSTPGAIGSAVMNASRAAKSIPKGGIIDNNVSITADTDGDGTSKEITVGGDKKTNESFVMNIKQLNEIRLRKLKENSEVVKINKFLK